MQVGYATRNDCILAETFLRLDHLETAMQKLKHEEMLTGVMMRLDNIQTEMNFLQTHTQDKIEQAEKQHKFRESVRCIVFSMLCLLHMQKWWAAACMAAVLTGTVSF
jgi:hypothetical protein